MCDAVLERHACENSKEKEHNSPRKGERAAGELQHSYITNLRSAPRHVQLSKTALRLIAAKGARAVSVGSPASGPSLRARLPQSASCRPRRLLRVHAAMQSGSGTAVIGGVTHLSQVQPLLPSRPRTLRVSSGLCFDARHILSLSWTARQQPISMRPQKREAAVLSLSVAPRRLGPRASTHPLPAAGRRHSSRREAHGPPRLLRRPTHGAAPPLRPVRDRPSAGAVGQGGKPPSRASRRRRRRSSRG